MKRRIRKKYILNSGLFRRPICSKFRSLFIKSHFSFANRVGKRDALSCSWFVSINFFSILCRSIQVYVATKEQLYPNKHIKLGTHHEVQFCISHHRHMMGHGCKLQKWHLFFNYLLHSYISHIGHWSSLSYSHTPLNASWFVIHFWNRQPWTVMNCHGVSWSIMNIHEVSWSVMNCHELSWTIMNCHEMSWTVMNCHEHSWSIMKYHEVSWSVMNYHEMSWTIMKCHEVSWAIMNIHGVSWTFMKCHGVSWSVMKCHEPSWTVMNTQTNKQTKC